MTNPIRVAQIVGKMNGGGVEAVVMNYYRHIDRNKVQFDFLIDSDSTLVPREEIESLGGRVFEIPPYQHVVEYQRELQRLFKQEGWKIVHSHINALSVFPLRAAAKAGVPVRIAHSHSASGKGEYAKNIVKSVLKTQSTRYPTNYLACSEYAGQWLFGSSHHFSILKNAVDTTLFKPNELTRNNKRRELGISSDQVVVGHIGRFMEQKNHSYLLKVFQAFKECVPNSVLLLIGNGPLKEQIEKSTEELGLSESVHFLGTRSDVPDLYQVFDVFCLPSLYEGLPVVGVESQVSGTPILASDSVTYETKITDLLEFESLDSPAGQWASHLKQLLGRSLNDRDIRSIASWDIGRCAEHLTDIYIDLLAERGERIN